MPDEEDRNRNRQEILRAVSRLATELHAGQLPLGALEFGNSYLDEMLRDVRGGSLVLVAARPSMGKTALVSAVVGRMAAEKGLLTTVLLADKVVDVFLLRLLAMYATVSLRQMWRRSVTKEELERLRLVSEALCHRPLYLEEIAGYSSREIRDVVTRVAGQQRMAAIVLDHLHLWWKNDEFVYFEEATRIVAELKAIGQELDLPVLVTACVNCLWESEDYAIGPHLAFFAPSLCRTALAARHTDVLIVIDREDCYHIADTEYVPSNLTSLIVTRNRLGPTGVVNVKLDREVCLFRGPLEEPGAAGWASSLRNLGIEMR